MAFIILSIKINNVQLEQIGITVIGVMAAWMAPSIQCLNRAEDLAQQLSTCLASAISSVRFPEQKKKK